MEFPVEDVEPQTLRRQVSPLIGNYSYTFARHFCVKTAHEDFILTQNALLNHDQGGFAVQLFNGPTRFQTLMNGLSHEALRVLNTENAGGNSEKSEAMSFEVLRLCFGAKLVKTEMSIEYMWSISKRTDYTATFYGQRLGVSVTRAYKHKGEFGAEDAQNLLKKKLYGVTMSTRDVIETDGWSKQVLHVWALRHEHAELLRQEYDKIPPELKTNTVVLVTVAPMAQWIFTNYT